MEAARISYNLLRVSSSEGDRRAGADGVAKPVHILTPIASVRRIVNMVALAVVSANRTAVIFYFPVNARIRFRAQYQAGR